MEKWEFYQENKKSKMANTKRTNEAMNTAIDLSKREEIYK
jgi:hypothetical protein